MTLYEEIALNIMSKLQESVEFSLPHIKKKLLRELPAYAQDIENFFYLFSQEFLKDTADTINELPMALRDCTINEADIPEKGSSFEEGISGIPRKNNIFEQETEKLSLIESKILEQNELKKEIDGLLEQISRNNAFKSPNFLLNQEVDALSSYLKLDQNETEKEIFYLQSKLSEAYNKL